MINGLGLDTFFICVLWGGWGVWGGGVCVFLVVFLFFFLYFLFCFVVFFFVFLVLVFLYY